MPNLLQAGRVWIATPSDSVSEPYPFVGLQLPADVTSSLSIVNLQGATVTWGSGELAAGVTYPISGLRVNATGTSSTTITLYGND